MSKVLCFDVDGTYIKYGIIENGAMLFKDKTETPRDKGGDAVVHKVCEIVKEMSEDHYVDSIGISTTGIVDVDKGEIRYSVNIEGYTGTRIVEEVEKRTGIRCCLENDVNAAAMGEMYKTGREGTFFYVTYGTSVGTTLVIDGKIYRGANQLASYGGGMVINSTSRKAKDYGHLASTSGLVRRYKDIAGIDLDGVRIMDKVSEMDPVALRVFSDYMDVVVDSLVGFIYLFDPGLILIGGGIAENKLFMQGLNKWFERVCDKVFRENTKIIPAVLGNDAGLYGMYYYCTNMLTQEP